MATATPAPVLDAKNGDAVTAQAINAMPSELSDRSDSNPAVVVIEACGYIYDWLVYNLNKWPRSVIQKCLALVGVTLNPARAATVAQTFTLSAPQASDTVVPSGTTVALTDASVSFSTLADLTIAAYTAPAGTIALTAGSAAVVGTGTAFVTGATWVGWQIGLQGAGATAPTTWFTILSVTNTTNLTLTATAPSTTSGAFFVGPISGSVNSQATSTGTATNVGAAKLTVLQSAVAGVASTTNGAAATGGAVIETATEAIARAPLAFAARESAITANDYAYHARQVLGSGGRAFAKANWNATVAATGYVTAALQSPGWTVATPVSASERGAVVKDLAARTAVSSTTIDVAMNIVSLTPGVAVVRKAAFDAATVQVKVAAALNTYLSPNTYPSARVVDVADLVSVVEAVNEVDRCYAINGVVAVSSVYNAATPATLAFVNGNATANTASTAGFTAGQTWIIDTVNNAAYLVISLVANTSVTFDRVFAGATVTSARPYFIAQNNDLNGGTANPLFNYLPFSSLGVSVSSPPPQVVIVGAV